LCSAVPCLSAPFAVPESAFGPGASLIDFESGNVQIFGLAYPEIAISGGLYGKATLEPGPGDGAMDLSWNGVRSAANFPAAACVALPACGTVRIDFAATQLRVGFYVMTGAPLGTVPDVVTIETFSGGFSNGTVTGPGDAVWSFIGVEDAAGIDRIDISAASVRSKFHMDFLTFQVPEPSQALTICVALGTLVLCRTVVRPVPLKRALR